MPLLFRPPMAVLDRRMLFARQLLTALLLITLAGAVCAAILKEAPPRLEGSRVAPELVRGPRGLHQVALTFDLGGELGAVEKTVETLRERRVSVTFFITGEWAVNHAEVVRQIAADGHEIGNHSWSHPDLTKRSDSEIRHELQSTEVLLGSLTKQPIRPLWRAPFGARNRRVLAVASEAGYRSIYWTLDSLDSVEPPKTADFLVHRLLGRPDGELDGAIILMHGSELATAEAVPRILQGLAGRGFRIVPVSEWLGGTRPQRK